MNAKPTTLDAYLARTTTIRKKPERLQQLADDYFGHDHDTIHSPPGNPHGYRGVAPRPG